MKYFGTDGIRGVAFEELTEDFSYKVGLAIGKVFEIETFIIGNDTRESGPVIVSNIVKGLKENGKKVIYQPDATTPMISYYSYKEKVGGIMITASHNPYFDNGIKIFDKGLKLSEEIEKEIEKYIDNPINDNLKGSLEENNKALNLYLELFDKLEVPKINLNVCYDLANGASYKVAPLVFNKFVKRNTFYNIDPNGKNINLNCGSTHLEYLKDVVSDYDIGFSFDGDADRCLVVLPNKEVIDGEYMLYIYAKYLQKQHKLNKNHLVLTKMSNPGFLKALKEESIDYTLTEVGDKNIIKVINEENYSLGGEPSGHIILNDLLHTGDAILMALYLLKIIEEEKIKLPEYVNHIKKYPFKLVNVKNVDKKVLNDPYVIEELEKIKQSFKGEHLVYIRPSGTEPVIRITMSYHDEELLNKNIKYFEKILKERS